MGQAWAAIHDTAAVPADRPLYLTATPRVAGLWAGAGEGTWAPGQLHAVNRGNTEALIAGLAATVRSTAG